MKQYAQSADLARASVRRHALHAPSHRLLVAALWIGGSHAAARAAAANYLRLLPAARAGDGLSAGSVKPVITPFIQALHDAGMPL
jgi:hypothetical protein